jgi:hypothetical protein
MLLTHWFPILGQLQFITFLPFYFTGIKKSRKKKKGKKGKQL